METELAGKVASKHSLPVWIAASATIAIAGDLHSARAAILWCMAIGLWAFYFWPDVAQKPSRSNPRPFSLAGLVIVLIAAAGTRLYRLVDLPLGPFVDEIFTLNSTLVQLEQPFDPFGHTLVLSQAWGKDHANLFLYLNLPVLKFFGVTYWSAKLLSVVPGVIACAIVFLIAGRVFNKPVAIATAVLFATAHWSIRLNRYGWDVSLGLLIAAYPFFCYYLSAPAEFWARTSEVSVFNHEHPLRMVLNNIASHALMFHWRGGTFARDNLPVCLVIPDVLTQTELHSKPAEEYANANPAVLLPAALWKLAIINFSGRYDIHQTLSENFAHPKDMYFVEPSVVTAGLPQGPAKIIFKSGNPELTRTADRLSGSVRPVPDILGEPLLTVAEFR